VPGFGRRIIKKLSGVLKWNHDFCSIYSSIAIIFLPQLSMHSAPTKSLTLPFNRPPKLTICFRTLSYIHERRLEYPPKLPCSVFTSTSTPTPAFPPYTWPFTTPISTADFLGSEVEDNLTPVQYLFYETCKLRILVV
jgi:hypothetical protein